MDRLAFVEPGGSAAEQPRVAVVRPAAPVAEPPSEDVIAARHEKGVPPAPAGKDLLDLPREELARAMIGLADEDPVPGRLVNRVIPLPGETFPVAVEEPDLRIGTGDRRGPVGAP